MLYSCTRKEVGADEIRCASNQLGLIIEYLRKNPKVRVNVQFLESESPLKLKEQIEKLSLVTNNYTISCLTNEQIQFCNSNCFSYYWNYPINNWEEFNHISKLNVTDILIDGPLCFQMNRIKLKKNNKNFLIRVCPTQSITGSISNPNDSPRTFFIRPDDVPMYESFIDILELRGKGTLESEKTLYKIYKNQSFPNDLSLLIDNLKVPIDNRYLNNGFTYNRLNCGQKCFINDSCSLCSKTTNFIQNIKETLLKED